MQEKSILFPNFAHFHFQTLWHFAIKLCGILLLNFVVPFGRLAQIRSVIWRYFVRSFGGVLFGKMAENHLGTWRHPDIFPLMA